MKKSTDDLWNEMLETDTVDEFIENNTDEIIFNGLEELFAYYVKKRNLKVTKVYEDAMLDRVHARQIINGTRGATRDKIIQLCFGLKLDLDEAQRFLKVSGNKELYIRKPREQVIIFAIRDGKSLTETNLELEKRKLEVFE